MKGVGAGARIRVRNKDRYCECVVYVVGIFFLVVCFASTFPLLWRLFVRLYSDARAASRCGQAGAPSREILRVCSHKTHNGVHQQNTLINDKKKNVNLRVYQAPCTSAVLSSLTSSGSCLEM